MTTTPTFPVGSSVRPTVSIAVGQVGTVVRPAPWNTPPSASVFGENPVLVAFARFSEPLWFAANELEAVES